MMQRDQWKQTSRGAWYYEPKYFAVHEVFPPEMVDMEDVWLYLDPRVGITIDRLREKYETAFMNTYGLSERIQQAYGTHYFRGWRARNCSVGASLSQHKMGCAGDMVFAYVPAESIRADILAQPYDTTFEYITCIETEVSWLHFDVRPRDKENKGILIVSP